MNSKIFSYAEASALLESVRTLTEAANHRLEQLRAKIETVPPGSRQARKLSEWINTLINQWAEDIAALGALPKGLWTVDFDSGEGYYYCWSLNEESLSYFHNYEDGFMGRKPLSEIHGNRPPLLLN